MEFSLYKAYYVHIRQKEEEELSIQFLENYTLAEPSITRCGTCCYRATDKETGEKYVAKVISIPLKANLTDALLLSGAYPDLENVDKYYMDCAREICRQAAILNALSHSKYFSHISNCQTAKRADIGCDVCLLYPYRLTLATAFSRHDLTVDAAIELGITLCRGALQCREAGFLYAGIKPENIYLTNKGHFQIGDIGFLPLSTLPYCPMPGGYNTAYFPPECRDCFSKVSPNADVYSIGAVLYQALHHGRLPDKLSDPPANADRGISAIILSACATVPEMRFSTPAELLSALEEYDSLTVKKE